MMTILESTNCEYRMTMAKRFPPYVYGAGGNACLVHRVIGVEIRWYTTNGRGKYVRKKIPTMIARTACGYSPFLNRRRARTCAVPRPDAVLCGVCHGQGPVFGKHGPAKQSGLTRRQARERLGCIVEGDVHG